MRSIIRREKTSIVAMFNWRSSMIVGDTYDALTDWKSCSFSELMPQWFRAYFSNSDISKASPANSGFTKHVGIFAHGTRRTHITALPRTAFHN